MVPGACDNLVGGVAIRWRAPGFPWARLLLFLALFVGGLHSRIPLRRNSGELGAVLFIEWGNEAFRGSARANSFTLGKLLAFSVARRHSQGGHAPPERFRPLGRIGLVTLQGQPLHAFREALWRSAVRSAALSRANLRRFTNSTHDAPVRNSGSICS